MYGGAMTEFIYAPPTGPLIFAHADTHVLVVDKPADLLSVPGKAPEHRDCLETRLIAAHADARLVHRLDMATSGLIVFARTPNAQKSLGRQFEKRLVEKRYVAVVAGHLKAEEGEVDLPLNSDWPNRPRQKVDHDAGRPAQTAWKVIARGPETTRVALMPRTGRTHQLRVHMAALGHPILGDTFYDGPEAPRLMLHAEELGFIHPGNGQRVTYRAACPF